MPSYAQRIVCLTEETCETLYLLGEEARIVGISKHTVRPAHARKEKPRVTTYLKADVAKIEALKPDLILGFSDLQADMAQELIKRGHTVMVFNQRSIAEILTMMVSVAALVGRQQAGEALARSMEERLDQARQKAAGKRRPRVYFEEWPDPLICGIRWVSELIECAGGDDIFAERRPCGLGRDRIVTEEAVRERAPDIILASWCGRKVRPEQIAQRQGWDRMPAVRAGRIHEIKSSIILQPGPAALTDGLAALQACIHGYTSGA